MKEKSTAYNYCIQLLAKRDYSEYKIRKKLNDREYNSEEIQEAIDRVIELNYLREDEYLLARVKGFIRKNYSKQYIKKKMEQEYLTISLDEITEIYNELKITEEQQIRALIEKKQRLMRSEELDKKNKDKLLRFLLTHGFDLSDSINSINSFF